jgi:hypothetical protein
MYQVRRAFTPVRAEGLSADEHFSQVRVLSLGMPNMPGACLSQETPSTQKKAIRAVPIDFQLKQFSFVV